MQQGAKVGDRSWVYWLWLFVGTFLGSLEMMTCTKAPFYVKPDVSSVSSNNRTSDTLSTTNIALHDQISSFPPLCSDYRCCNEETHEIRSERGILN